MYLENVSNYGNRKLKKEARDVLAELLSDPNFKVSSAMDFRHNESLRLTGQHKLNNLIVRMARGNEDINCELGNEDISESFQKALVALQNREQKSYGSHTDHLNEMMQIGMVSGHIVKENRSLIKETLSVITDEIIPERSLIDKLF